MLRCSTPLWRGGNGIVLDYIIKTVSPSGKKRLISCNDETYRFFWPYAVTSHLAGARPLCRWLAKMGTSVNGAIRVRMRPTGRCYLYANRPIPANTPLVSIPRSLVIEACSAADDLHPHSRSCSFEGRYSAIAVMTGQLVRDLHDSKSIHRRYAEFLYDIHNVEEDDELSQMYLMKNGKQQLSAKEFFALKEQLEDFYAGNVLHANGVPNAPFMAKEELETASGRLEWVRLRRLVREVQHGVPHFAAPSVPWALSMVLARSIASQGSTGRLAMCPLIDMCDHSYHSNAILRDVTSQKSNNKRIGVPGHDFSSPCLHLFSARDIRKNESISVLYSARTTSTPADRDYWRINWGFVPQ